MFKNPRPDINLDSFAKWHDIINDNINDFLSTLAKPISAQLDYSMESLDVLGKWLLEQYSDVNDSVKEQNAQVGIHRGLIYYVGEVYRKYLEGHWNVHFKELEPDYEFGEEPVIEGFHHDVALCPYLEILITLSRKNEKRLSGVLRDFMKLYRSKRKA